MQERIQDIDNVKIGFIDFLRPIDFYMLQLMAKLVIAFIILVSTTVLIYLGFIYTFHEDKWHRYFPVNEYDNSIESQHSYHTRRNIPMQSQQPISAKAKSDEL